MSRADSPCFLIDTNVILDVMLDRRPWSHEGVLLFEALSTGKARGLVAAHAVTTVHYMIRKAVGSDVAREGIRNLLKVLDVVPVDAKLLKRALELDITDYEDAVHVAAAIACGATSIVTRDHRDYSASPIVAVLPAVAIMQTNEWRRS